MTEPTKQLETVKINIIEPRFIDFLDSDSERDVLPQFTILGSIPPILSTAGASISSRIFICVVLIGNSLFVFPRLGPNEVAAGSLITLGTSVPWAILRSIAHMVSILAKDIPEEEHGNLLFHGWMVTESVAIPISALMFFSEKLLTALGISAEVALASQSYFRILAVANLLYPLNETDLQWMLLRQHGHINLIASFSFTAVVMTLGYYLALAKDYGLAGISWAYLMVLIINMSLVRGYGYLHSDFQGANLFQWPSLNKDYFVDIIKKGTYSAIQSLADMINPLILSFSVGSQGKNALAAAAAAIQLSNIFSILSQGYGMGLSLLRNSFNNVLSLPHFVGNTFVGTALLAAVTGSVCIGLGIAVKPVTGSFLSASDPEYSETLALGIKMMKSTLVCIFIDAFKNSIAGMLRGIHEINVITAINFLLISMLALPIGYFLSAMFNDASWNFDIKTLFTLFAVIAGAAYLGVCVWQMSKAQPTNTSELSSITKTGRPRFFGEVTTEEQKPLLPTLVSSTSKSRLPANDVSNEQLSRPS